jgi:hypothetical protein
MRHGGPQTRRAEFADDAHQRHHDANQQGKAERQQNCQDENDVGHCILRQA